MKKGVLACAIASVALGSPVSFNFQPGTSPQVTAISGKISPQNGAETVKIIGKKDSVSVSVVDGNFMAQVKPGKYRLVIQTRAPFKSALLENLEVRKNQSLNIGEIILQ